LAALRCDVLLLQEVDEATFWREQLERAGYELRYKQRTQATGAKKDGCLVAWRRDALRCVEAMDVEHNDLAAGLDKSSDNWSRLSRDSVAVLVRLQSLSTGRELLLGTTHVYWDPALEDVKNAQVSHLLRRYAAFREATPSAPCVLGGDFNSRPGSEAHTRLLRGCDGLPPLRSVFEAAGAAEPEVTNHTATFSDVLDYLVCGGEALSCEAVLLTPTRLDLAEGLPDAVRPSDHLPLVADVCLC
jgi:mRNA deadenylase 3'-5' endonuclease subunit Ccr4